MHGHVVAVGPAALRAGGLAAAAEQAERGALPEEVAADAAEDAGCEGDGGGGWGGGLSRVAHRGEAGGEAMVCVYEACRWVRDG